MWPITLKNNFNINHFYWVRLSRNIEMSNFEVSDMGDRDSGDENLDALVRLIDANRPRPDDESDKIETVPLHPTTQNTAASCK